MLLCLDFGAQAGVLSIIKMQLMIADDGRCSGKKEAMQVQLRLGTAQLLGDFTGLPLPVVHRSARPKTG